MKHVITFRASFDFVIADDEARLCRQWSAGLWRQVNLPERAYLAALDGARWLRGRMRIPGWLPGRDDWRLAGMAMVGGGEYWQLIAG